MSCRTRSGIQHSNLLEIRWIALKLRYVLGSSPECGKSLAKELIAEREKDRKIDEKQP
jgi:hypothetical protein